IGGDGGLTPPVNALPPGGDGGGTTEGVGPPTPATQGPPPTAAGCPDGASLIKGDCWENCGDPHESRMPIVDPDGSVNCHCMPGFARTTIDGPCVASGGGGMSTGAKIAIAAAGAAVIGGLYYGLKKKKKLANLSDLGEAHGTLVFG